VLSVMGPLSRELLQRASGGRAKLDNESAPFGSSTEIELGYATVRANRVTYVGELGWELYIPSEFTIGVFEALWAASRGDGSPAQDLGLVNAGYFAIDSLRLEKGYRAWGHDLSPSYTPYEAGLGFAVKLDKASKFVGQEALRKFKAKHGATPPTRMVSVLFRDPDAYPLGDEPILRDNVLVGYLSSAGWGHTLGKGVGLGYVSTPGKQSPLTKEWLEAAQYEVEVHGKRWPVDVSLQAFYDPKSTRVKM
jgi:glycine cleavage system aminomethyltransferase T